MTVDVSFSLDSLDCKSIRWNSSDLLLLQHKLIFFMREADENDQR